MPGNGNIGRWLVIRDGMGMEEGGRGMPFDMLLGKIGDMGEALGGKEAIEEATEEVMGDAGFGRGGDSLLGDLTISLSSGVDLGVLTVCKR